MQCAVQSVQNVRVRASRSSASASVTWGAPWLEGIQHSTNGTRSPADTVNAASWDMFRPTSRIGVRSQTASGPATADRQWSTRRIQGSTLP